MHAFEYHRPTRLADAAALLSEAEGARLLAGGQSLLPEMKLRRLAPAHLVDLARVPGLSGIERRPEGVTIGAMTTHAEVGGSCALREAIPALAELIAVLGDPAVRHRGTLGGSLAWNDPRADYAPACVALGATIVTDRRAIGSDAFFTGSFETALERAEIVVGATFLIPDRAAYVKFRNPASRYALAGVFVAQRAGAVRVAVTGAGTRGVFRWPEAEAALGTDFMPGSLDGLVLSQEGIGADIHGDAQYRVHLVGIMARRAVRAALER